MAVVIKKVAKATAPVKQAGNTKKPLPPVVKKPTIPTVKVTRGDSGRPLIGMAVKIGNSTVLPDIDIHDVLGGVKFLVHLKKPGIWYKITGFDEGEGRMILTTKSGVMFEGHTHRTIGPNYMVVQEHGITATEPSTEAIEFVQGLLTQIPEDDSPPWKVDEPKASKQPKKEPEPEPKKKIVIKKVGKSKITQAETPAKKKGGVVIKKVKK